MPSKLPVWHSFRHVWCFSVCHRDSAADQTKPISLLIGCHSKSISGQASMFQMGRCKRPTGMAGGTGINPAATKNFFSLRNLCGQGKGAGREAGARVATRHRDLAGIQPQTSPCHPSPQSNPPKSVLDHLRCILENEITFRRLGHFWRI